MIETKTLLNNCIRALFNVNKKLHAKLTFDMDFASTQRAKTYSLRTYVVTCITNYAKRLPRCGARAASPQGARCRALSSLVAK